MTEADWLACREPGPLLDAVGDRASLRKWRLFLCACCRRVQAVAPHVCDPAAVDVAERFADGLVTAEELRDACRRVGDWMGAARRRLDAETRGGAHPSESPTAIRAQAEYCALSELDRATSPAGFSRAPGHGAASALGGFAALKLSHAASEWQRSDAALAAFGAERAAQADLVRDLLTDRLWFVVPDPSWFTADVMALAQNIYDGRAFEHMPILADALQDAGCDSDAVLNHCRNPSQLHARGCWVVDLILGFV